ncbi:MAG: hypothetical protein CML68_01335 [Rhodobacteraceae bacterium]|nr:hypothetical protein [Paracoccaceae bacterium]
MFTPLDVWAPIFRAPFSGDVTQAISPSVLSPEIKGSPQVEQKVLTEVASYGKQLGKILEALKTISDKTGIELDEIDQLIKDVQEVKDTCKVEARADAEAALDRLKRVDEEAWTELTTKS